jgi:hypothetical protein
MSCRAPLISGAKSELIKQSSKERKKKIFKEEKGKQ